jgi:hypothetical protein
MLFTNDEESNGKRIYVNLVLLMMQNLYVQYNIWLSCIRGIPCVFLTPKNIVEDAGTFEFKL